MRSSYIICTLGRRVSVSQKKKKIVGQTSSSMCFLIRFSKPIGLTPTGLSVYIKTSSQSMFPQTCVKILFIRFPQPSRLIKVLKRQSLTVGVEGWRPHALIIQRVFVRLQQLHNSRHTCRVL